MNDHAILSTTISILSRSPDPGPTAFIPSRFILKGNDTKVILSEEKNLKVIFSERNDFKVEFSEENDLKVEFSEGNDLKVKHLDGNVILSIKLGLKLSPTISSMTATNRNSNILVTL